MYKILSDGRKRGYYVSILEKMNSIKLIIKIFKLLL